MSLALHGSDSTPTRRRQQLTLGARLELSAALGYSLAPVCIVAAVLLHVSFVGPHLHPTGLFLMGVVAAAWFGGAGPGLLAALLATLVLPKFVPRLYPVIADFFDLPRFLTFAVTGLAVGWGTTFRRRAEAALRKSELELREARNELETKVAERTADLRFSEERYARALDASNDGLWEWNIQTDEMFVSTRMKEILGFAPDARFMSRADFFARQPIHPDDRRRVNEAREASLAGKTQRYEIEYRVLPRAGELRWVRSRGKVFHDSVGRPLRISGSLTDITDRKRADEAIRRSEEGYALAMEASGEGHWDWNIVTDEYHASPRMLEMYGFPPGTTFKNRADFLARFPFHPDDRPRWEEAIAAHFAGKTARFDIEIRMVPRGETRWIHLTGLLTRDASGKPVRWTGSAADITERRCAEDELRLSEQRYALAIEAI